MSDFVRQHVRQLSNRELFDYLRIVVRNGDDTRAAIADMELHRRGLR